MALRIEPPSCRAQRSRPLTWTSDNRWQWLGLAVLWLALLVLGIDPWRQVVADFFGRRSPFWVMEDFRVFYAAGRLAAHGQGRLLYEPAALGAVERSLPGYSAATMHTLAYFNPPFFALLCAPLTRLPLDRAYQLWTLLSLGLLALDCRLLWLLSTGLRPRWRALLLGGFCSVYPIAYGLQLGQFSLLLVTAWAGAYLLLVHGRPRLAGLTLAVLLLKPELLLPPALFLAWKRRWQIFSTLLPLTLLVVAVSVAVIGWNAALAYPAYLVRSTGWQSNGVAIQLMYGWNGLLAASWSPLPIPPQTLAALGLSAFGLAIAAWAWRGELRPGASRFPAQWLLLTLATLLADPHLYLQDTLVVAPAALALLAQTRSRRGRCLAGVAMAAGMIVLRFGIYPNQQLHFNPFAILMALPILAWPLASLLAALRRPREVPTQRAMSIGGAEIGVAEEAISFADGS